MAREEFSFTRKEFLFLSYFISFLVIVLRKFLLYVWLDSLIPPRGDGERVAPPPNHLIFLLC